MARLEEIVAGTSITGLASDAPASVIAVEWHGTYAITVTFKDASKRISQRTLYREDEGSLSVASPILPWSFDANAEYMRLASEAYRISLAHLFDPYLAVHASAIEPLPHQISAVYQEMLTRLPLRYMLADDPGSGKTVMTGLLIRELIARGDLKRCMVVTPGSLAEQWQDELYRKFGLRFEILSGDLIQSASLAGTSTEPMLCIARLDRLSRSDEIQEMLRLTDWDLTVVDEAHKMSATVWGGEIKYTRRFRLGQLLSRISRNFLLLTATPHNGKEADFRLFLSLIDEDRFEGALRNSDKPDLSDIMRRLVKEDLLKFDGSPLFPERMAYTVNYSLSENEAQLYEQVTKYVQEEFNRADSLENARRNTVGFALTILQRRLASSPEAICQSLKRRRERLEMRMPAMRLGRGEVYGSPVSYGEYDEDDMNASELEDAEDKVLDQASAARTAAEMAAEIETLKRLERMAFEVRSSGQDRKWEELSRLIQDEPNMYLSKGVREKLIVFTEHRDTLIYLAGKIRSLLGDDSAVLTIHGGMSRDERHRVEEMFRQDSQARILVATDAAGEGVNLQRAHLMINYDLPWNPNRLEQRFGRIHRIGQTEVCHLWNLVSSETREGMVYARLLEKLGSERKALGGKVFDVLGKITFDDRPLRDLMIEAVRNKGQGNGQGVLDSLERSIDRNALKALIEEHALAGDAMDMGAVTAIREEMERMEAHKLQPHFIESFFIEAFQHVGGTILAREEGRYEIKYVPFSVRGRQTASGDPVLERYKRICFDRSLCEVQGQPEAAFVAPGSPLLDATLSLVLERTAGILKRGAIFIDENDFSTDPRLLFYVEDTVQDGVLLADGERRVISRHVHFVELKEDGTAQNAGYAPYLDYRPANEGEQAMLLEFLSTQSWLNQNVEETTMYYAMSEILPEHLAEVKERKLKLVDKTIKAVRERLNAEINYWDYRASELKVKESEGKGSAKMNSQLAYRRADELEARLKKRLAELDSEKIIMSAPPAIAGGAAVIPRGLLDKLEGKPDALIADAQARRIIELAAMKAVMEIESSLGYMPKDVSAAKVGYDVESFIPQGMRGENLESLRFIEVKGWEKMCDGLDSAVEWCKKHWKLLVTIAIVILAVVCLFIPVVNTFLLNLLGKTLCTILMSALGGALGGAGIGGLMGGLTSMSNGGDFWVGFEEGSFRGALAGLATGALGGVAQVLAGSCKVL